MSVDKFCKFKIVPEVGAPINYFSVNVALAPTFSTNVKPRCAQLKTYFRKFQIKNDVLLASSMTSMTIGVAVQINGYS